MFIEITNWPLFRTGPTALKYFERCTTYKFELYIIFSHKQICFQVKKSQWEETEDEPRGEPEAGAGASGATLESEHSRDGDIDDSDSDSSDSD